MMRRSLVCASASPVAAGAAASSGSLLGYPIRRAAASEMMYGGVRLRHLAGHPFALNKVRSEEMSGPSLARERHDLQLEIQLPGDVPGGYNNVNMNIQRQLALGAEHDQASGGSGGAEGAPQWHAGTFFGELHHPERHHSSSVPYSTGDTNNVMGLRLFPLNLHARMRTDGVRIKTQDCLDRLRDAQLCQAVGKPVAFPLPLATRYAYTKLKEAMSAKASAHVGDAKHAHLRGGHFHPPPKDLSIFTRPIDRLSHAPQHGVQVSHAGSPLPVYVTPSRAATISAASAWAWKPLQMLKPMTHSWSASMRSSGTRGPHMQLMQERLDQKGFGWKRKSRSLWQQDIATAGFRPHRYF